MCLSGVLLVRDVMTREVRTVGINSGLMEAVRKMNKFNIGSVVVVDTDRNRLVGILTERDVLKSIESYPELSAIRVKQVMSHPLITVDAQANIEEAAKLMTEKSLKRLPVTEDGRLIGIITSSDIMRASPILVNTLTDILRSRVIRA
jgi:CBS domain-containing protein